MDRRRIMPRGVLGVLSLFLVCGLATLATADPIRPWTGARATIFDGGPGREAQGAKAVASENRRYEIAYSGNYGEEGSLHEYVSRAAEAKAGTSAEQLLQVRTSAGWPNLGTRPYVSNDAPPAHAQASWSGDSIRIASNGGDLPKSIRVKLGLDFSIPDSRYGDHHLDHGSIDLEYQNQVIRLWSYTGGDPWASPDPSEVEAFYASAGLQEVQAHLNSEGLLDPILLTGTVSFDLSVDEAGVSDPLNISLKSFMSGSYISNFGYGLSHSATLSLLDLTLPDGTPLHEAGYSVTFDSGLDWPQPVPEPAPIALLGAGMILAGWTRWRKRAGA